MGKTDDIEYHKLEDHLESFASYLSWAQFLRGVGVALLCQTFWPYLEYLQPQSSPWDFIWTVVIATLTEVFGGVWNWYAFSLCCGFIGSLFYLLPAQVSLLLSEQLSLVQCVVCGRVLLAYWVGSSYAGSATEIERSYAPIFLHEKKKAELLSTFERMRISGYLSGTVLGLGVTYLPTTWLWFEVEHIRYPAGVQALTFLVTACWFLSAFPKFLNTMNGEKEQAESREVQPWEDKLKNCSEDDMKKLNYVSASLRHWGVFSGLFSNIVLHFSAQVRDVVFPILLLPDGSEFTRTVVDNDWGLRGVFALFAVGAIVGLLGRELYVISRRVYKDRTVLLPLLLLAGVGWTLLIPRNEVDEVVKISKEFLVSGFVLVSLGVTTLPECSYNVYHQVLGPKTSSFYMTMFLLLGGMGASIAPLWAWETMKLDAGLCFGFVNVWLGLMLIILIAAWTEAVPYNEFLNEFAKKIPQKNKVETS